MVEVVKVVVSGARGPASDVPGPAGTVSDASGFLGALAVPADGLRPELVRSTDLKALGRVDMRDTYSGVGTATKGAPRRYIGTRTPTGDDSAICIGREIVGAGLFSHAIRDETTFVSTGTGAYASFDAAANFTGATAYNHSRGYQYRHVFAGSGSISEMNGFGHQPVVQSGAVDNLFGLHVFNAQKAPGATINIQAGVWIDPLSGAAANYGVFINNNPSAMLGDLTLAGAVTGVTTLTASGQVTTGALLVSGNPTSYGATGGWAFARANGSNLAEARAYSDAGGTLKGAALLASFVVVGQASPVSSAGLQVKGGIDPTVDNATSLGSASLRFSTVYAGTGAINTSDERLKKHIGAIPDEWLDAWGRVGWQRFRFRGGSRWHIGLIAQAVHAAFQDAGLDAFEIGLCCLDRWDEERRDVLAPVTRTRKVEADVPVPYAVEEPQPARDDKGRLRTKRVRVGPARYEERQIMTMQPVTRYRMERHLVDEPYEEMEPTGDTEMVREAGDRWGLRYDECFAIEAAWQRREIQRLSARSPA